MDRKKAELAAKRMRAMGLDAEVVEVPAGGYGVRSSSTMRDRFNAIVAQQRAGYPAFGK